MEDENILKEQSRMKVQQLVYISMGKLEDACKLLKSDRYEGSCYNGGYAVECIIKYIFLEKMNLKYYNKEHFNKFVSNYNKLKKLMEKEEYFKENPNVTIPEETKEFLSIINNDKYQIVYDINIESIEHDIEAAKKTTLKHLNEINKSDETINATNMKQLDEFSLRIFEDVFEPKNYEELEEYKEIINKVYKKVLTEHSFIKALRHMKEINKSDWEVILFSLLIKKYRAYKYM